MAIEKSKIEKSKFKRIQKLRQKASQAEKKLNKLEKKWDFIHDKWREDKKGEYGWGKKLTAVQDETKKAEDKWIKIIKQLNKNKKSKVSFRY